MPDDAEALKVDWYFDVISPFAYLQLKRFPALPDGVRVVPRPVLFAGLLAHHGQLGPAEIPSKRLHTYRLCQWMADEHGIPFRMPPRHPFNPLAILRLLASTECRLSDAEAAFDAIFGEGCDPEDPETLALIASRIDPSIDADAARARSASPEAKAKLKANTDEAIARGVFGVPTFHIDGQLFWGIDAAGMLLAYLKDRNLFASPRMRRLDTLPALQRPSARPASARSA